ncbi:MULTISPECIES: hypothetical protein [Asticcacaulis]|uniref:hypothetical protein n=1 Tax=Asticcacaulis TaxID=76890 RepID=UPI001AE8AA38|nr:MULTISPECIES: hypothetical protein [Asticcacaulis]MBP2159085.1 hypothetical protein [Asticcacaulis solisilvae]MDR6800130.1 hypothetical protein [Asticcacaulis sp. BE141]
MFAVEVPLRAHTLLKEHWASVKAKDEPDFGGPLATTFVVTMAGPMFNYPYERIKNPKPGKDERHLAQKQADEIVQTLKYGPFKSAPFFKGGVWRYLYVGDPDLSVVALPEAALAALSEDAAFQRAEDAPVEMWVACMRNALAHSTVAYLNGAGRQIAKDPTEEIVFVSERLKDNLVVGFRLFRISREDFRAFLDDWIKWLCF